MLFWLRILLIVCGCLIIATISTPSVLISSPFDNFRIECPRYSGAQRLSIRMIESQGMKRQDTVFAISCNHINEVISENKRIINSFFFRSIHGFQFLKEQLILIEKIVGIVNHLIRFQTQILTVLVGVGNILQEQPAYPTLGTTYIYHGC